jgi:peptidoglycan hydrolase-like protein with peptidoglycan-binding domain
MKLLLTFLAWLSLAQPHLLVADNIGFGQNLSVGSKGVEVVRLQDFLELRGYLFFPLGVSKGYFGPLTKMAVMAYQTANGIAPANGFFGPVTRQKVEDDIRKLREVPKTEPKIQKPKERPRRLEFLMLT